MSLLFNETKQNISLHINNCFQEGELEKNSTVKEIPDNRFRWELN